MLVRRSRGMAGMLGLLGAVMAGSIGNNAVEIKASPYEPVSVPSVPRMAGMSASDFARHKARCGRPSRKKNLAACARKAKLKRRRG